MVRSVQKASVDELDDLDLEAPQEIKGDAELEALADDQYIKAIDDLEVEPQLPAVVERRPMDEAPQDGTVVTGYHPESYPEGQPVRWKAARQYHMIEKRWASGGKWVDATYLAVLWQQPTEWTPLSV